MVPKRILDKVDAEQAAFLEDFFLKCNESFFTNVMLKTFPKKHILMDTDDNCAYVCILLKGRLQAVEEQVVNQPYSFLELGAIEIVGDYELFTGENTRIITLITIEKSLCLMIPSSTYISWIKNDAHALTIRIQMLIRQTVEQTKFERHNFFLDNHTRLLYFLSNEYENQNSSGSSVKILYTRPAIANKLGCSLRTVNRAIASLQEKNLLSLKHGKIHISAEQYSYIQDEIDKTASQYH